MITWQDDTRRAVYAALAAADDEATRLAATVPATQAIDAAQGRIVALAIAAQDAAFLVTSAWIFRMRADLHTKRSALATARRLEKLTSQDVGAACPAEVAHARAAVDTLLSVFARDEFEPTYELAALAVEMEEEL